MGTHTLAAAVAFVLALALTPLAGVLATRVGAVSHPRPDRLSRRRTPLLGGAAVLVGFLASLAWFHPGTGELGGLLAGTVVIFLVGLVDDRVGLTPAWKIIGQVLAACTLIATEMLLGVYPWDIASIPILIVWIVAITNAFNLLDNMDGLAGGVAAITAGIIFIYARTGDPHVPIGAVCIGGAALGFTIFNLPPARVFLGDSGSHVLGFVLAALAARAGGGEGTSGFIVPVLLLGVPVFDTLFVMITRTLRGRPVTEGGKDHLSHRLLEFGLSGKRTLFVLYALSAGLGGIILWMGRPYPLALAITGAAVALVLGWFGGLLSRTALASLRPASRVGLDLVAFTVAFLAAYLIRFEGRIPEIYIEVVKKSLPLFVGTKFLIFAALDLYRPIRGTRGVVRVFYGCVLGSLLAVFIATMAWRFEDYSRAVFVIDGMITFLLVVGIRYAASIAGEALAGVAGEGMRVALVGKAESLRGTIAAQEPGKIEGVIRIDGEKMTDGPVPDLGSISDLGKIAESRRIRMIWLLPSGMDEEEKERVRDACVREGMVVREVSLRLGPS